LANRRRILAGFAKVTSENRQTTQRAFGHQ